MKQVRDTIIGKFRLKCKDCKKEFFYTTGANLLQLGDTPEKVECPLCFSKNVITVEVPNTIDYNPPLPG